MTNVLTRKEYAQYFQVKQRTDGTDYICKTDNAPKELEELVRDIHCDLFDAMPNDWIYQVILDAFESLEIDDIDHVSIEPDPYPSDLIKWLENGFALAYCDEALECGIKFRRVLPIIMEAQYMAKRNIYDAVASFIEAGANEDAKE